MIKHKRIGLITALLMAASVLLVCAAGIWPEALSSLAGSAQPLYVSAMDKTAVLEIQIVADEQDWAAMLENATAEEYIAATVIINGTKLENVGIRPKGNSSLSTVARDDTTDRYSFKIEFDHYVSGQTWLGLDKLAVNNMQGDASYMKEYLSYDILSYVGVAAPLYAFSNISVNGESWGFYLAVETLEDSYARRVYGSDHGKLYKPEGMGMRGNGQMNEFIEGMDGTGIENLPQLPDQAQGQRPQMGEGRFQAQGEGQEVPQAGAERGNFMENFGTQSGGTSLQYADDEISSYSQIFENAVFDTTDSDYRRVISALKKLSAGEELESAVDVEATLKYFAAHTVVVNLDSYVSNMCHNYYLYEKDGRLTILPWDYNLAFGGFQSGSASAIVNFPVDTPVSGVSLEDRPLLAKLLEAPEYLELYHSYLRQIVDGYFNSGLFAQTVDALDALISPYVQTDPSAFYDYSAYQSGVSELKKLGILRAQSIEGQLDGSIPSTSEVQNANPDALVDASSINLSALGSMGGGGFGGMAGENRVENGNLRPGDFGGGNRPEGAQWGGAVVGENPNGTNVQTSTAGFDGNTWTVLGLSAALLTGGLLFALLYKRRRAS